MGAFPIEANSAAGPQAAASAEGFAHIEIYGHVQAPFVLALDACRRLPSRIIEPSAVGRGQRGEPPPVRHMRATALAPLVLYAHPVLAMADDFRGLVVVLESVDGYQALYSWMELFHSPIGRATWVAFDAPDAALPDEWGAFAAMSLLDDVSGPRFVRRLERIRVQRVW